MFAVDSLIKMVTNDADAQLPLRIRYVDAAPTEMTTIERVWLQMWRSGSMVQDRAVYQFRTAVNRVVVELPPQVMAQEVETLVDGELAAVTMQEEGRLTVELENPPTSSDRSPSVHTLELRYRHPADTGLIVHRTFIPPQLVGTSALSDVYWQVVLPGDEHVVRSPTQLAAVDRWQWLDMFIGRRPLLSQSDLERWVGGSHQSEYTPSFAQNAYVYSGVAPVSSIEFVTAPRWLIVFVASGAVLAIATFWLYLPVARRKWLGIATVVGVAGLAATYPTAAVLLGQASLLGWALAGVVALMRKWQSRPIALPPASTGSTNLRPRVAMRSDSFVAPSMSPPASSVSTTPVSIPESER